MKNITFLFLLGIQALFAQDFTEYLTGNAADVTTNHQAGVCLMGGNSEQTEAMKWFLNQAHGGDVVVLRASGSDGYNNYFYSQLGVSINSVRTFVIHNTNGAVDPYVLEKVANAEAIWFAGGDQYDYVNYFKDNAMEDALNAFINTKKGVIGGLSAGMAIMGSAYFSAENGVLESDAALLNPYHARATVGYNDFLEVPFLEDVIADSHFANRNRQGRISVFLARFAEDNHRRSFGIASDENTAITINTDGKAIVYGSGSAYFLQANCTNSYTPETIVKFQPLTWKRGGEAIKVYKIPGNITGSNYFDLSDWETGNGGTWQNWSVDAGILSMVAGTSPMCGALSIPKFERFNVEVYPNPVMDKLFIKTEVPVQSVVVYDLMGKELSTLIFRNQSVDVSSLGSGVYILKLFSDTSVQTFRIIKK